MKVAAISGYKPFEIGLFKKNDPAVEYIKKAIRKELEQLLEEGLEWVLISGQLGTELWAAEVVYDMQINGHSELKLGVVTPFLNQEQGWKEENKEWYEEILMQADFVDSVSKKDYEGPNQLRMKNVFLLQKSDVLLMFYDTEKTGSPKYLYDLAAQYKERNNYDIRLIGFYDLQAIVDEEQYNNDFF
ncbi:DUF1273 domain-containing protein [Niallia taxi]|uniref:DUF1273 domain-containing protein n=1 Tax=Niallia taxi TaxID=2499688 RepID=UPI0011A89F9E|nr:DUF1273 domain-containing protein [Niallia taxi]MDE5051959.1 DUF1273 domain-containing protein [Niallia taxi]MED3961811.1 DUF1273 domain-containing protein [Niallia taxi]WOD64529.1 DUF1273 domain-containing protein [Niallia taxi]